MELARKKLKRDRLIFNYRKRKLFYKYLFIK